MIGIAGINVKTGHMTRIRDFKLDSLPRNHKQTDWLDIGSRHDGGNWRPPLLILACVHRNEYARTHAPGYQCP